MSRMGGVGVHPLYDCPVARNWSEEAETGLLLAPFSWVTLASDFPSLRTSSGNGASTGLGLGCRVSDQGYHPQWALWVIYDGLPLWEWDLQYVAGGEGSSVSLFGD